MVKDNRALKVWFNGLEWILAYDIQHLRAQYKAYLGRHVTNVEWNKIKWIEWKTPLRVYRDRIGNKRYVEHTPDEWAQLIGPGVLASTECG